MRFRIKAGGPAAQIAFDRTPVPENTPEPPPHHIPTAAELDNPYGRYYGRARSREELLKNR